jgi:hypothetical protein
VLLVSSGGARSGGDVDSATGWVLLGARGLWHPQTVIGSIEISTVGPKCYEMIVLSGKSCWLPVVHVSWPTLQSCTLLVWWLTEVLLGYGYRLARVLAYLLGVLAVSVLMAFVLGSLGVWRKPWTCRRLTPVCDGFGAAPMRCFRRVGRYFIDRKAGANVEHRYALNYAQRCRADLNCTAVTCSESVYAGQRIWPGRTGGKEVA